MGCRAYRFVASCRERMSMIPGTSRTSGALVALLATLAGLAGCSSSSASGGASADAGGTIGCGGDPRAQSYAPGMAQMGKSGAFRFILENANPQPVTTDSEVWTLKVTDGSGAPVTDATFPVMHPWMPLHGHGTAGVVVTNNHDGTYTLNPMDFYMVGLWQIDMTAASGSKTDSTSFFFCLQ